MDRHSLGVTVTLALAVALAGCGAVGGDGGAGAGADGATPTLTPAPVPVVTDTPVALPPGMTGDGVTNPDRLLAAHRSALDGASYTLRVRVGVGEAVSTRVIRLVSPSRFYTHDVMSGPRGNVTQFATDSVVYAKMEYAGVTQYAEFDNDYPPDSQTVQLTRLFLRVGDAAVYRTTVDGDPAFAVAGSYPVHPEAERLRNYTVRAVVEPGGLVRSLNVSYVRDEGPARTNVTRSFTYSDVGSTEVAAPPWVDREFNATAESGSTR